MRQLNILVIEDVGTPSLSPFLPSYTSLVSPDEANILIITSNGGLSHLDKQKALVFAEVESPSMDGSVEMIALGWHIKFTIDSIYTRHEDLLLRAASLRRLLKIENGMTLNSAFAFRNKAAMKQVLSKHQVPVVAFARLYTPSDLIMFADTVRFPLIVKPTFGSASAGLRVLGSRTEMLGYLRHEFLHSQLSDSAGRFDCSGELMVEAMLPCDTPMFHVNGLLVKGKVVAIWPFAYVSNNLSFTGGNPYGNTSLLPGDPAFCALVSATHTVLDAYEREGLLPQSMAFHAEFFLVDPNRVKNTVLNLAPNPCLVLCEIAARRPGGSIVQLMDDMLIKPSFSFSHFEFRALAGLSIPHVSINTETRTADLLIPHKPMSLLLDMPNPATFPLCDYVTYIPSKGHPSGLVYTQFSVNSLNTVARFMYKGSMSVQNTVHILYKAAAWFSNNVHYMSVAYNAAGHSLAVSTRSTPIVHTYGRNGQEIFWNKSSATAVETLAVVLSHHRTELVAENLSGAVIPLIRSRGMSLVRLIHRLCVLGCGSGFLKTSQVHALVGVEKGMVVFGYSDTEPVPSPGLHC